MKHKAMRKINKIITRDMGKRLDTVWDLEQRARDIIENGDGGDFYRGFLRAIEMLRERNLLKEGENK